MKNRLSNNLIALMDVHQIGSAQLARAISIPLSTIKNIRKGVNVNPTIETLIPLARYFKVSIEDMISGDFTTQTKNELNHHTRISPQSVPVITWEDAISSPVNTSSEKQVFTEKPSTEIFALNAEQNFSEVFSAPGVFLIDPRERPNHFDYVLVHKIGLDRASIRQFIRDEDCCYLKSLVIHNSLSELNQNYRLLGVVIEYRQFFKSTCNKIENNNFFLHKKINEFV